MRKRTRLLIITVLVSGLIAAACGSDSEGDNDADGSSSTEAGNRATGEPIPLGFVNITEDPGGNAQPDIWDGARAAEQYINDELGGVNGRPMKLTQCNVTNAPESGTACGAKLLEGDPVAVLDGINTVADGYMPTLLKAGVPYISGSPLSISEFTSANSFLLGGGTASGGPAFALFARDELKAKKIVVAHVDLPPAQVASENFIKKPLAASGVSVDLIPVPAAAPDMAPILSAALARKPDAIYLLTPDPHCIGMYKALASTPTDVPIFYAGNCASDKVITAGGKTGAEGAYYVTGVGPVADKGNPNYDTFVSVMKKAFPKTALSGASGGFSTVMTTYKMLKSISADITRESVMAAFKTAKDQPLWFDGTFTCDGKQFPGLSAICSTYAVIAQYKNGKLSKVKDIPSVSPLFG